MKIKIQVIIEAGEHNKQVIEEIGCLERGPLLPESLGLTFTGRKGFIKKLAA